MHLTLSMSHMGPPENYSGNQVTDCQNSLSCLSMPMKSYPPPRGLDNGELVSQQLWNNFFLGENQPECHMIYFMLYNFFSKKNVALYVFYMRLMNGKEAFFPLFGGGGWVSPTLSPLKRMAHSHTWLFGELIWLKPFSSRVHTM